MKKSEQIKAKLDAVQEEYVRKVSEVGPGHEAFSEFWRTCGRSLKDQIEQLKLDLRTELNREIAVGDGVTMCLYTDRHAYTVIARTAKTLTIRRDKATLNPCFKPEIIPGGFVGHCVNQDEQSYTYEENPDAMPEKCYWSEKRGGWQSHGRRIIRGRHEFFDYNF